MNVAAAGPTSVHVTWLHVSTNQEAPLWGYRIVYWSSQTGHSSSVVTNRSASGVEIGGLWSGTKYSLHVMDITSEGFGEATSPVVFNTPAQGTYDIHRFPILPLHVRRRNARSNPYSWE